MGVKFLMLGLLIVAGGLVSLALGYAAERRDRTLNDWPSAQGAIVSSAVVRTTEARLRVPATHGFIAPDPTYRQDQVWGLAVEYHYAVRGKKYTGYDATSSLWVENVRPSENTASAAMQHLAAQLAAGSETAVHYNPEDPSQSYLAYINNPGKARLFRIGGICVALGLLVAAAGRLF